MPGVAPAGAADLNIGDAAFKRPVAPEGRRLEPSAQSERKLP
jgi:hypothetical protein